MDIEQIISALRNERERIDRAITALQGSSSPRLGRPVGSGGDGRRRGPRHMSAEARRRISEAQKRRWAEQRKRAKS